jgi:hypothetical protein
LASGKHKDENSTQVSGSHASPQTGIGAVCVGGGGVRHPWGFCSWLLSRYKTKWSSLFSSL